MEKIKLSSIEPNPENPREINVDAMEKLKKSISEFTAMMYLRPIVVDENNIILGGNMRYAALIELGYDEVPSDWIKKAENLTEDEKRRFIIADNIASGDWDLIKLESWDMEDLEHWGFDTSVFNIETDDIENVVDTDETDTFNTQIMNIRHNIAKNISETDHLELSDAYLKAESIMIETLIQNEHYTN